MPGGKPTSSLVLQGMGEIKAQTFGGDRDGQTADKDRELVRPIARFGAVAVEHVMAASGVGRTATYRRVAACIERGLLERLDQVPRLCHRRSPFVGCLLCLDTGVAYLLKPDTTPSAHRAGFGFAPKPDRYDDNTMRTGPEEAALAAFIDSATSDVDPGYPHGAAFVPWEQGTNTNRILERYLREGRPVVLVAGDGFELLVEPPSSAEVG